MKKKSILLFFIISVFLFSQKTEKKTTEYINEEIKYLRQTGDSDPDKAIFAAKKIYTESKKIDFKEGMLNANRILMTLYFNQQKYENVIMLSKETEQLAKEFNHFDILSDTYRLIGSSYIELGLNNEGYKEHKTALEYAKKIKNNNTRPYKMSLIFLNMAVYFENMNQLDSALVYHMKSLKEVEKIPQKKENSKYKKYQTIAFINMNIGITLKKLHKINLAEKHFLNALKIYRNDEIPFVESDKVIFFSEIATFYLNQKKYQNAISFAQEGIRIEKKIDLPIIRNDIYETLFISYSKMNNIDSANYYLDQYKELRSNLAKKDVKLKNIAVSQIVSENDTKNKNQLKNIIMITGIIVLGILLIIFLYWKKHNKVLHQKYKVIIETLKDEASGKTDNSEISTKEIPTDSSKGSFMIMDDTVTSLLNKLSKFEESHKFTKSDMSLPMLAAQLNTNTKYLSSIINEYKAKNFNNYINGLRINYIMKLLYEKPEYREYKTSYLAECCGFSSRVVFTTVFKKETGITPSYFINSLKNEEI